MHKTDVIENRIVRSEAKKANCLVKLITSSQYTCKL